MRFPEFKDEWQQTTLGEVGVYIKGLTYITDDVQEEGETIVVRANNLTNGSPIDFNTDLVKVVIEPSVAQLLQKNDLVICMANGSSHLVGKVSYYNGNYSGSITIGAFCGIFRSNNVLVRWILQSTTYRRYINQSLQGGDGAIANLKGGDILSQRYFLPSFVEQEKIASFLSLLDERIEVQRQTIKERKAQKKALLRQIFSQALRFPGFSDEWQQTTLGEVASILGGGTPRTEIQEYWNGDIQWFTPSEIGLNKFVSHSDRTITTEGLNNSGAKLLPIGTILLTTRATIGEVSIATIPCTTNQGFQSLVADSRYTNTEFVYQKVQTLKNELLTRANGSTFKEISASEIRSLPIALPSLEEQEKIASFLSLIDERIEMEEQLLQKYEEQKRYLLRKMFV